MPRAARSLRERRGCRSSWSPQRREKLSASRSDSIARLHELRGGGRACHLGVVELDDAADTGRVALLGETELLARVGERILGGPEARFGPANGQPCCVDLYLDLEQLGFLHRGDVREQGLCLVHL